MESVHLQLPAELLARVDEAAGDVPRNRWIRRAVEQALGDNRRSGPASARDRVAAVRSDPPAPAEQPEPDDAVEDLVLPIPVRPRPHVPGPNVENVRTSSQSKRDVRPIPKGGK